MEITEQGVRINGRLMPSRVACVECGRVFDLWDEDQASEWYYGHDCEA